MTDSSAAGRTDAPNVGLASCALGQVLGDEVLASAILDRLRHHADVISISGPSYRLKDRMLEQRDGDDVRHQA